MADTANNPLLNTVYANTGAPAHAPAPAPAPSALDEDNAQLQQEVQQLWAKKQQTLQQEIELNDKAQQLDKAASQPQRGWVSDTLVGGIVGGVVDAARNIYNFASKYTPARTVAQAELSMLGVDKPVAGLTADAPEPEWAKPQTTAGGIVHGVTEFAVGLIGPGKFVKGLELAEGASTAAKVGINAAKSGVSLATAFDPMEKRLSNLVQATPLKNPVTGWLAAGPDDSDAEGRLKNAVEGMGLGAAGDLVFGVLARGIKAIRGAKSGAVGENFSDSLKPVPQEAPQAPAGTFAPSETLAADKRSPLNATTRETIDALKARGASQDELLAEIDKARTQADSSPVTGFPNAAAFENDLQAAQAGGKPIAMLDGRKFKAVNDTFGHAAGDDVLRYMTQTIQQQLGGAGKLYHLHGEEFAVIGNGDSAALDKALKAADDLLSQKQYKGVNNAGGIASRAGLGFDYGIHTTPEGADSALYAAKQSRAAADGAANRNGYITRSQSKGLGEADNRAAATQAGPVGSPTTAAAGVPGRGVSGGAESVARPTLKEVEQHLAPSEETVNNIAERIRSGEGRTPREPLEPILNFNEGGIDLARVAALHGDDASEAVRAILNATSRGYASAMEKAGNGVKTWAATNEDAAALGMNVGTMNRVYGAMTENGGLAAHVKASRDLLIQSAQKVRELAYKLDRGGGYDDALAFRRQLHFHAMVQAQVKGIQKEVGRALNSMKMLAHGEGTQFRDAADALHAVEGEHSEAALRALAGKIKNTTNVRQINQLAEVGARRKADAILLYLQRNGLLSRMNSVVLLGNSMRLATGILSKTVAIAPGMVRRALGQKAEVITASEVLHADYIGTLHGFQAALRLPLRTLREAGGKALKWDLNSAKNVLVRDKDKFGNAWRAIAKNHPMTDYTGRDNIARPSPMGVDSAALGNKTGALADSLAQKFGYVTPDGRERFANFGDSFGRGIGHGINTMDKLIGLPIRGVIGNDEAFRTVTAVRYTTAYAHRLAVREAEASGLRGKEYLDYITNRRNDLVKYPEKLGDDVQRQIIDESRAATFQERGGKFLEGVHKILNAVPELRFILPFINTPSNIVRQTFEWSPVPLAKLAPRLFGIKTEYYNMLKAGGAKADEAIARMAIGTGLIGLGYTLASNGLITGMRPGGKTGSTREGAPPPYSIRLGKYWYGYNRLDPLASYLGISADLTSILNHGVDPRTGEHDSGSLSLVAAAAFAVSKNTIDKAWMSTIANVVDALSDPGNNGPYLLRKSLPGIFIPYSGMIRQINQINDPVAKEVFTVMEAFENNLPYFNKNLAPMRDMLGRPIKDDQPLHAGWYSPLYITPTASSPIDKEMERLSLEQVAGRPQMPPKSLNGVPLSSQQYSRYLELRGQDIKVGGKSMEQLLNQVVETQAYKKLTDGTEEMPGSKLQILRRYMAPFDVLAQRELFKEYPELDTANMARMGRKFDAKTGSTPSSLAKFTEAAKNF